MAGKEKRDFSASTDLSRYSHGNAQSLEARNYAMKLQTKTVQYHIFRVFLTVVNETITSTLNKLSIFILYKCSTQV